MEDGRKDNKKLLFFLKRPAASLRQLEMTWNLLVTEMECNREIL